MAISCLFCDKDVTNDGAAGFKPTHTLYMCKRCGYVWLTEEAAEDFSSEGYSSDDKAAISITLRNKWEREGRKPSRQQLKIADLKNIVSQFQVLDPISKIDQALIRLEKSTKYIGHEIKVNVTDDFPLFYCKEHKEIMHILIMCYKEGFISATNPSSPQTGLSIEVKGYQRLREIQKLNRDSRLCFVAMWLKGEIDEVFDNAIKPAIEFVELNEITPRYQAVKIDNVEHVNDINDEIIAQIRRSRFMVCDLTGYRGGVYFEAGFANGLGLEVIYTCRKDWVKEEILRDSSNNKKMTLLDSSGKEISVKKEGVHFDLSHRNRIEWESDKLEDFKTKLENRIKAVLF